MTKTITVLKGTSGGPSQAPTFSVNTSALRKVGKVKAAKQAQVDLGQRGKSVETEVDEYLTLLNEKHVDFAFSRLPDARAAGGRLGAVLCDFLIWGPKGSVPLEVKETAHDFRLSKARLSQLAKLKKVAAAKAKPLVLVYHTNLGQWRVAPIDFFQFGVPSWDLSNLELFPDAASALASTNLFPK